MYQVKLKINHKCSYLDIANLFNLEVLGYCSEIYDLMVIPKRISPKEIEKIRALITDKDSLEANIGGENANSSFVYFKCMCSSSSIFCTRIQKNGGLVEHPVVYRDGYEHYTIVTLNEKSQSALLSFVQNLKKEVEELQIISIKAMGPKGIFESQFIPIIDLMNDLTDRQIDVILRAFEQGYYEIPRTVKTQDLADQFNVSRIATEKSLRKAENAIMRGILPYLRFYQKSIFKDEESIKLSTKNG